MSLKHRYNLVLVDTPLHLSNAPSLITKQELYDSLKTAVEYNKELETENQILKQENQMLKDINDRLDRNLRIFTPGQTIGDTR